MIVIARVWYFNGRDRMLLADRVPVEHDRLTLEVPPAAFAPVKGEARIVIAIERLESPPAWQRWLCALGSVFTGRPQRCRHTRGHHMQQRARS